jgi:hypothetical protein
MRRLRVWLLSRGRLGIPMWVQALVFVDALVALGLFSAGLDTAAWIVFAPVIVLALVDQMVHNRARARAIEELQRRALRMTPRERGRELTTIEDEYGVLAPSVIRLRKELEQLPGGVSTPPRRTLRSGEI